jgi:HipA-like C-terminal domain
MPVSPRIEQHPDEIVSLEGWLLDEEFPYAPQGAKPKRILICPNPPPHSFLIGGHRYLFKEPVGSRAQQIWSEVIAYELSRDLLLPVPPAFLAQGPGNGSPGVLVEFFYGYPSEPEFRLVHAIERLQGLRFPIDYDRGSLKDNVTLCRLHRTPDWRNWWARTLAFDAVIGNSDRHTENWGFLVDTGSSGRNHTLAPAFDNGTSLGYIIREEDLNAFVQPARLGKLVAKGTHHFGWVGGDSEGAQHARLCRQYRDRYLDRRSAMDDALALTDNRIALLVDWCCSFAFALPFTEARGRFVAAQLRARRDALATALGA